MNRYIKRAAAFAATAAVLVCGGIFSDTGTLTGSISASAAEVAGVTKQSAVRADVTSKAAVLSWEKQSDVRVYSIYSKGKDGKLTLVLNTSAQTAAVSGLTPKTQYTFVVKGQTKSKLVTVGETDLTTTDASSDKELDKNAEKITLGKVSAEAGLDSIKLTWEHKQGILSYEIYSVSDNGETKLIKTVYDPAAAITDLEADTEYTFEVRGKAVNGHTEAVRATARTKKPELPLAEDNGIRDISIEDITAKAAYDSVTLSWGKIKDVKIYNVYIRQSDGSYVFAASSETQSVTVKGLSAQTEYTFLIRGQSGGAYTKNSYAAVTTLGAESVKVSGLKSAPNQKTVKLTWDKFKGAKSYNVYQKVEGEYKLVKQTTGNSVTFTGLEQGVTYSYAVRANVGGKLTKFAYVSAKTLRSDVTVKFQKLNQLGGKGNSGKVVATYGCGGTSTTMLMNAKGKDLNKDDVLKRQYTNGWNAAGVKMSLSYGARNCGSVMSNLVTLAKSYGFEPKVNTSPEPIDIMRLLNEDKLVLVGLRTASGCYHFQIIYGYYIKNGVTNFRMQDPYGNTCADWTASYLRKRIYSVNMSDWLTRQVRGIMWL